MSRLSQYIDESFGGDFRAYIEDKYYGRIVKSSIGEELEVDSIACLNFQNLDHEDKELAIKYDWAWGIVHEDEQGNPVYNAFLFRPTQREFLLSDKPFIALWGGFGCGKTFAGCLRLVMSCYENPGMHCAVYRTTVKQLLQTTMKTLMMDVLPGLGLKEGTDWRHRSSPTYQYVDLFIEDKVSRIYYKPTKQQGVDLATLMDDQKSFNVDMILVDESEKLSQELYFTLQGRRARHSAGLDPAHHKVMLVGNTPNAQHYQYKMHYLKEDLSRPGEKLQDEEDYQCWWTSTYDNRDWVTAGYLKNLESKPEAFRRTYLMGEPGYAEYKGLPVYSKYFNPDIHLAYEPLPHDPTRPLAFGFDCNINGAGMACIIAQTDRFGTQNILFEIVEDQSDALVRFIRSVREVVQERFPRNTNSKSQNDIVFGDPSCFEKSKIEIYEFRSPAQIMQAEGFNVLPGAKRLQPRTSAVNQFLTKMVTGGRPGLIIDKINAPMLAEGFSGAYRWELKDDIERIKNPKPIKNIYSHPCDAHQYLCTGLLGIAPDAGTGENPTGLSQDIHQAAKRHNSQFRGRNVPAQDSKIRFGRPNSKMYRAQQFIR